MLGCAHEAPGGSNFTLGMDAAETHACVHRYEALACPWQQRVKLPRRLYRAAASQIHGNRVPSAPHKPSHGGPHPEGGGKESEAEGLARACCKPGRAGLRLAAPLSGEEPRKGCLPRAKLRCAAVKTACTEQVWDVSLPVSSLLFSLKGFHSLWEKKAVVCLLCVMKYRTHRYPDPYMEKVHCLRGESGAQLWGGGDFGIGSVAGRMVCVCNIFFKFFSAKNMAQCPRVKFRWIHEF